MKINFFVFFDYILFFCVLVLSCLGISFIYSSGVNSEGISVSTEYIRQIVWVSIGVVLLLLFSIYDFRKIRRFLNWISGAMIIILVYTKFFGRYVNGARSWIGIANLGVQPSEFCKIVYILFLAEYFEKSVRESPGKRFITALCIMLLPMTLILLQPDLGTASVFIPIFIVMCFVAGVPLKYILLVVLTGGLTILFTIIPVWQSEIAHRSYKIVSILTFRKYRILVIAASAAIALIGAIGKIIFKNNKYYYWIAFFFGILTVSLITSYGLGKVLKTYQLKRLIVYIDPSSDPLGSGWNIIQSKIAIGSGGPRGRGFLNGTQSHYRFLPQQSTDFIFSILSEEFGFIGGSFVFILYLTILVRIMFIMINTKNTFGYYIASGILGMFFFHFVVNVGMVMGIMPITGIPLLFLSYGGSSLLTAMICVGLLISVNLRKLDLMET
ncbi:rod shape-determining protein RodA [Treponema parvum]|uniref:Peptidoglycan glycosyltransferase RodA n=1 Tax=Treponema parvum TaxID=138851 RepID=A0A975F3Y3_9SPIR|nr:rod shape-determining protein RodA [Treponema parvum]QTQ13937.1 rod shape-determining protein RodA [Treponema parvum]